MNQKINEGDIVIFNPHNKIVCNGPKFLQNMRDHIAVVLKVEKFVDEYSYTISFEPALKAVVSFDLIEKIVVETKEDVVESWFQKWECKHFF